MENYPLQAICICTLLLSKGHYLHRMSHTQKQTNMLLCIRGLSGDLCSLKLSRWILLLLAAFISRECHVPAWQRSLSTQQRNTCWCQALLWDSWDKDAWEIQTRWSHLLLMLHLPWKYRQLCPFLYWMTHWYWSKGWEEDCQHAPKLKKRDCLVRCQWSELWKTTGYWTTTSCTLLQPAW